MKIIFNKYGGIKTIEDRQLLVQTSNNANYVDIYYQDDDGNFADQEINLATIAFKRADTFEISEKTCDAVREELTNQILYFRHIFQEDELAVNGELQITVRLKQVTFDPEDETQILLIKQRTMGKLVAHIYEAIGTDYEQYNVIDGRLLQLELWQSTFDGTYYDVTQIDAKFAIEVNDRNQAIENHDESNTAHDDIRQTLANNASAINSETLSRQSADNALDGRIDVLEAFKTNLNTDITDEIAQAVNAEKTAREEADTVLDNKKVDKVDDKSLIADSEIERLALVDNYDDTTIKADIAEAKAIAEGKARARVFATVTALDTWLLDSENVALLLVGDNFYIEETDKPDYWWNGTNKVILETEKVDLTDYAKTIDLPTKVSDLENDSEFLTEDDLPTPLSLGTSPTQAYYGDLGDTAYQHSQASHAPSNAQKNVQSDWNQTTNTEDDYIKNKPTIPTVPTKTSDLTNDSNFITAEDIPSVTIPDVTVNNGSAESGKYISQVEVDGTNKHKLNITKENLPTLRPTIELEVASLTTLTEAEKLAIRNTLNTLIVSDKIDGTKFDDIVLVTTTDLIRLHYSSIDYYVANPQITVIFETQSTKYILNIVVGDYTYSTLTSTTTTIPTISTSITTDATDDTKTASPKAVKTYVDNAINSAILGLLGGES